MLIWNFFGAASEVRLTFRAIGLSEVSITPPPDLSRQIAGETLDNFTTWLPPRSPMATRIFEVFRDYLQTGELYRLNKLGFFSSVGNRRIALAVQRHLARHELRVVEANFQRRADALFLLLGNSYGIVNLTYVNDEAFDFWPPLTGFHIGLEPRDINIVNCLPGVVTADDRVSFTVVH